MLLEMVGERKNINAEVSHTSEIHFPHWVYNRLEQNSDLRTDGVIATEENGIERRMTLMSLRYIQMLPNDRPKMSVVIDTLKGSTNSLGMPPKPVSSTTRSGPETSTTWSKFFSNFVSSSKDFFFPFAKQISDNCFLVFFHLESQVWPEETP